MKSFIRTTNRTVLPCILKPFGDQLTRAFREQRATATALAGPGAGLFRAAVGVLPAGACQLCLSTPFAAMLGWA